MNAMNRIDCVKAKVRGARAVRVFHPNRTEYSDKINVAEALRIA
jgi:hypothetical protein